MLCIKGPTGKIYPGAAELLIDSLIARLHHMETITVSQKRPGERGQASDAAPEAAEQGDEQEKQRKRARLSCNTCKARKTKVR